jgi:8-oxo-dGTP pyrophosphatase MutT (NUDIX family)
MAPPPPQIAAGTDAFSQSTPLRSTAGDLEPPLVATSTIAPTARPGPLPHECPLGAPAQNARPSLGGIGTSRGPEARSLQGYEQAARRELFEETGIVAEELGPVVLERTVRFTWDGVEFGQTEHYFKDVASGMGGTRAVG